MLTRATLTRTLLGFIFLFFSGWIFYDTLTPSFFEQHYINMPSMMATEMNYIALGVLIQAYVLSLLYSQWAKNRYNLRNGFKIVGLLGLFIGGRSMISLGTVQLIDLEGTLVDTLWQMFSLGVAGSINGSIFRALK
ncbi:MAG: hypothetical protein EBS74_04705 [Flavobacteriia bacterium]|nr:hypothetical protein [Flavobacteriia bacterium]